MCSVAPTHHSIPGASDGVWDSLTLDARPKQPLSIDLASRKRQRIRIGWPRMQEYKNIGFNKVDAGQRFSSRVSHGVEL